MRLYTKRLCHHILGKIFCLFQFLSVKCIVFIRFVHGGVLEFLGNCFNGKIIVL